MKKGLFKFLLLIVFGCHLLLPILFGCHNSNEETKTETKTIQTNISGFQEQILIVKIDGCQYLYGDWMNATILTHKGNCNNPIHKLKSE